MLFSNSSYDSNRHGWLRKYCCKNTAQAADVLILVNQFFDFDYEERRVVRLEMT